MPSLNPSSISAIARYDRASVERALNLHYGDQGAWVRYKDGYMIATNRCVIRLNTLREAAILVHGVADGKSKQQRLIDPEGIIRGEGIRRG